MEQPKEETTKQHESRQRPVLAARERGCLRACGREHPRAESDYFRQEGNKKMQQPIPVPTYHKRLSTSRPIQTANTRAHRSAAVGEDDNSTSVKVQLPIMIHLWDRVLPQKTYPENPYSHLLPGVSRPWYALLQKCPFKRFREHAPPSRGDWWCHPIAEKWKCPFLTFRETPTLEK